MKMRKIAALALATVMLAALFSGCALGGKTVLEINGNKISEQLFLGAVGQMNASSQQSMGINIADMLDQDFGDGTTGADALKQSTDSFFKDMETVKLFAKENGIELLKEDKKAMDADFKAQIEEMGGQKAFLDQIKAQNMTEEFVYYMNDMSMIYRKINDELLVGDGKFAMSADEILNALSSDFVRVKHVLVQADSSAEDYAEKRKLAETIAKKAQSGADFDALIEEYGEDPGMETNTEGYVFDKDGYDIGKTGMMVSEFSTASNALSVNGVSGIVETSHGFHIIKRLPIDKEYVEKNAESLSQEFAANVFYDKLEEYSEKVEIKHTKAYDKIDLHKFFGKEKAVAPAAPQTDGEAAPETEIELEPAE